MPHFLPDLRIWSNGNDYQAAADLLNNHRDLGWAAAINAALAIEIYLKSFLAKEVRSSWDDGVIYQSASECERGHDFVQLFNKIDPTLKHLLLQEFKNLYPEVELASQLEKYKDYFFRARYRFEPDSRGNIDNGVVFLANKFKEVIFKVAEHTDPTYKKP
jgi:hypothetical protein